MLCCSESCPKKQQCGLYWRNPQPGYRKYDNVESLDSYGWGSISAEKYESHYDCGPLGHYKMFEPLSDQFLYEKIATELSLQSGITIPSESIKEFIMQYKEEP